MESSVEKNKKILKNTLYMYGRMLIMLFISLFTARVVFNTLGVNDYGTYNLVAGIIVFFTFLNNGLSAATKRYITAEIAKGDNRSISHVFYICILAHLIIALIILGLAETVGLWGVNNILNIPADRMYAANWVYQLSVIATILNIVQSPFGSVIVAYEKMNIYAYFTIFDAVAKLFIIYMVQALDGDKLIIYAFLIFGVSIVNMLLYRIYTYRAFPVCRLNERKGDKPLLKEIFSFMSWSILGQTAVVGANQGVSVLINVYYNVAVNAAMGVSNTITTTVQNFIGNFQVAFNPQIVKSYVSREYDYLQSLIIRASKLSSFLIIIFIVPLIYETHNVLILWLGNYPKYAVEFCIFTLFANYFEAISAPLWMTVYAQTDIKRYQIVISSFYSLNFFGSWIALFCGMPPFYVVVVRIIIFIILTFIRLYFTKKIFKEFQTIKWMKEVVLRSVIIIVVSSAITGYIYNILKASLFMHIFIITIVSLCCTIPLMYIYGLSANEKLYIKNSVISLVKKFFL